MFDLDPHLPDTRRRPALSDRVFDWVNGQILDGALVPGQWVSENEVAELLGVSRSPVREAFAQLVHEGLLDVRRRVGTVVAELSAQEAGDLYELRRLIDSEMASRAVREFRAEDVQALEAICSDARDVVGDRRRFSDCTRRVWQLLMDRCPNRVVCDVAASLWRRSIRMRSLIVLLPEGQRLILDFHESLLDAARRRDGERAAHLMSVQQESMRELLLRDLFIRTPDGEYIPKLAGGRGPGEAGFGPSNDRA